jgi:hypothetical protein
MRAMRANRILRAMDSHHPSPVVCESSNDVARKMHWAPLAILLAAAMILAMVGLTWLWLDVLT